MSRQNSAQVLATDVIRFVPTPHAIWRMAQRNVSLNDIFFILHHGVRYHGAGAIFVYLRKRDIPDHRQAQKCYSRLEGTTVVISRFHSRITTVYRNKQRGIELLKHKSPYNNPRKRRRQSYSNIKN